MKGKLIIDGLMTQQANPSMHNYGSRKIATEENRLLTMKFPPK